jgi:hypothetical protein
MKRLLTFIAVAVSLAAAPSIRTEEITRFLPMKAEQLNPEQKKWADGPAAQCEVRQSAVSRLHLQSGSRQPPERAVGISALEYLAAAAPERTGDPDHGAAMDRAV